MKGGMDGIKDRCTKGRKDGWMNGWMARKV